MQKVLVFYEQVCIFVDSIVKLRPLGILDESSHFDFDYVN